MFCNGDQMLKDLVLALMKIYKAVVSVIREFHKVSH